MNERIRELANQCYETGPIGKDGWPEYSRLNEQKFAELIVRECVNRIEQNRSSGENTDSWTITRDMAFHQMKEDLKKHFGVEE